MGYLTTILNDLRAGDAPANAPAAWSETTAHAWLTAMPDDFAVQRDAMITALRRRLRTLAHRLGPAAIERALAAMAAVRREAFVCPVVDDLAYLPGPIAIGADQIMSHPELVAVLAAAADPRGGVVLDVGTGSGYQAAVLAQMAGRVDSVEIVAPLARLAATRLQREGCANVTVQAADAAALGHPADHYDAIVVAAGAARVPPELLCALRAGGRLVMPIGPTAATEWLTVWSKHADGTISGQRLRPVRFVPLTGRGARAGRSDPEPRAGGAGSIAPGNRGIDLAAKEERHPEIETVLDRV